MDDKSAADYAKQPHHLISVARLASSKGTGHSLQGHSDVEQGVKMEATSDSASYKVILWSPCSLSAGTTGVCGCAHTQSRLLTYQYSLLTWSTSDCTLSDAFIVSLQLPYAAAC